MPELEGKAVFGGDRVKHESADCGLKPSVATPELVEWKADFGGDRVKKPVEVAAVAALRLGDVRKALRILSAAPLAPKTEATLAELRRLHPADVGVG